MSAVARRAAPAETTVIQNSSIRPETLPSSVAHVLNVEMAPVFTSQFRAEQSLSCNVAMSRPVTGGTPPLQSRSARLLCRASSSLYAPRKDRRNPGMPMKLRLIPFALAAVALVRPRFRPTRELPDHAQDQHRRVGGAAERGAHLALCGEGAGLFREALHRRQHRAVRGRPVADLGGRGGAGLGDRQRQRRLDRPRPEGAADLGARAAHAAGLHGAGRDQDRGRSQGQAAVRDRRRRRRLQLADGPRGAQVRQARRRRRAVHPLADRGPPARPDRRPDRRRRAASRGRVPRAAAEVDAAPAGAARRADAALHVQRLWRLDRLDRQGPRRCCATPSPR